MDTVKKAHLVDGLGTRLREGGLEVGKAQQNSRFKRRTI